MQGRSGPREISPRLRQISDYAWRVLLLGGLAYGLFLVAMRFELIFVALFIALIFTSLLRPPVNALARVMPRSLALVLTALCGLGLVVGLFWFAGNSVANESSSLNTEFHSGVTRIEHWLEAKPFNVNPSTLSNLQGKLTSYISGHRTTLLNQALNGAGRIVDVLTVLALAVFCAVFFTSSGDKMWHWFQDQLPDPVSETWRRCGTAAWHSFAGYTRGIILVSAANAVMVGVALKLLHVPLVLPLTILEFIASFIPLIGSPIAMAVATVVALASQGVTTAIIVLCLIVVFGQIEGHVLQPFVMGWSVRLHPVVVAVSVIGGTISAGLLGAVVAVPLVSITWAVIRELRAEEAEAAVTALPDPRRSGSEDREVPVEHDAERAEDEQAVGVAVEAAGSGGDPADEGVSAGEDRVEDPAS
jgi:predicted PurR-regulated permease PerM